MGEQNWRTETNSSDYFGHQKKQLGLADRRPVIRKPSDLVGPGIAATAVRLTDFNDVLATYDGFFSTDSDVSNGPPGGEGFVGLVSSDSELGGLQLFTGLTTETTYQRVFRRNPSDAATIYWGDWVALGTGSGSSGTGIVETIVEGANITVDDTDPANPEVSASFTETLPATIIDAKGDLIVGSAADTPVRKAVGSDGQILVADTASTGGVKWTGHPEVLMFALSDETTPITTGTNKLTVRMPFAMTLIEVRANLNTASSSGTPTVDINEAGTSILSTKLTIDASEKTSTTAATPAVISDASLADDAEITFDIDTAGTGAKGLKVTLIGTRT